MRKIKCWIVRSIVGYLLISNEPARSDEPQYAGGGSGIGCKVHASDSPTRHQTTPIIPEYVMEAYKAGVTEFEIIEYEGELVYNKFGLLKVLYEIPKRQTFTRGEVLNIIIAANGLEKLNYLGAKQWLDNNFK